MVDSVNLVFKKNMMVTRLIKEGRGIQITREVEKIMDNLDGQPVSTASWSRAMYDKPVYICKGKDGKFTEVNELDCIAV